MASKGNSEERTKGLRLVATPQQMQVLRAKPYRAPGAREQAKRLAKAGKLPFPRTAFTPEAFNAYAYKVHNIRHPKVLEILHDGIAEALGA